MYATGQEVPCSVVLTARTDLDTHPGEFAAACEGYSQSGSLELQPVTGMTVTLAAVPGQ